MVRLRNAAMAVALGTSVVGCALTGSSPSHVAHYSIWHCDECDDFPTPAYGPGYSMVPGSYTQPPAANHAGSKAGRFWCDRSWCRSAASADACDRAPGSDNNATTAPGRRRSWSRRKHGPASRRESKLHQILWLQARVQPASVAGRDAK